MNTVTSFFGKVLVYFFYKKNSYLFKVSKRHVTSWGVGTYGEPKISCFDGVSKLSVGAYVPFASEVSILLGANHKRGMVTTYPYSKIDSTKLPSETNEPGNIVIGNDVWIGYGATIIGPVTIGDGAIIGAGAVVVHDISPYAVAVGVPAKVVKHRFSQDVIESLIRIAWWNWDAKKIQEAANFLYTNDQAKSFVSQYDRNLVSNK